MSLLNLITPISIICIFLLYYVHTKYQRYKKLTKLHDCMEWCTGAKGMESSRCFPLMGHINNAAIDLDIPMKYRISEEEYDTATAIVNLCVDNMKQLYFADRLSVFYGSRRHPITGEDFFMINLQEFLKENSVKSDFFGNKMHSDTITYKAYGCWGAPLYDAKYSLTGFAITFSKLELISYEYCRKSISINPKNEHYKDSSHLKERIDTRTIAISCF